MSELKNRASGVLMHISSLPGTCGIGTLGKYAYSFIDKLCIAGQSYWQLLPICPTGYGDSPYQSFSTSAGNPYFIDFEELVKAGFLDYSDYELVNWGNDEQKVDYGLIYINRKIVFEKVYKKFFAHKPADYDSFCIENEAWLDDYALFMAIKDAHGGVAMSEWEDEIRFRKEGALAAFSSAHEKEISYYKMLQYLFFTQWNRVKSYANDHGIKIIGDLPIYVSSDSVDVWAAPKNFMLDDNLNPVEVAGCPPDCFAATGQLWGNPVYNWNYLKETGYEWWKARLDRSFKMYDIIRIDHFRGFESFYCIPAQDKTAEHGVWREGPGMDFFEKTGIVSKPVIAEDLGFLTDGVRNLLKATGFPGMNVLQFAFDTRDENDYLPEHYIENSVVYTGTHDNDTILGWTKSAPQNDVGNALAYFSIEATEKLPVSMMEAGLRSKSNTCILTMQDLIGKDGSGRMNTPSTQSGNWQWRATEREIDSVDWKWLRTVTESAKRLS